MSETQENQDSQEKQETGYPKFLYHKEHGGKLIHSSHEEKELGKGWEDTPAKFGVETHPGGKKMETVYTNEGKEVKKEVVTSDSKADAAGKKKADQEAKGNKA